MDAINPTLCVNITQIATNISIKLFYDNMSGLIITKMPTILQNNCNNHLDMDEITNLTTTKPTAQNCLE